MKKRAKTSSGCPFSRQTGIATLHDQTLLEVQDIEQLVTAGRKLNACPYYASRKAVSDAEVVVLPYNTLLHKPTREACGINLNKNSVVIVDEAHNLLDTIAHIHSAEVKAKDLEFAKRQISQYQARYKSRLSAKHLLNVKQVLFIITSLAKVLDKMVKPQLMSVAQLLNDAEIFNLNLSKLTSYMEQSKLAQKVGEK